MTSTEIRPIEFSQTQIADELRMRCPAEHEELIRATAGIVAALGKSMQSESFWQWDDDTRAAFIRLANTSIRFLHKLGPSHVADTAAENICALACVLSDQLLEDTPPAGHA